MPEISRFFGIIIAMYYNDHYPEHFHARYGNHQALISIETLSIINGYLPPRVLGLVTEWASQHREDLTRNWNLARMKEPLESIQPLE